MKIFIRDLIAVLACYYAGITIHWMVGLALALLLSVLQGSYMEEKERKNG